jgi:hypothetical protein
MNISLPSVIQSINNVLESQPESKQLIDDPNVKKFVLVITKDLMEDEIELFKSYGRFVSYKHDLHTNIDLFTIDFSYFVVDLREKNDVLYLQKFILPKINQVHFILYRHRFQNDNGVSYSNQLTSIPPIQVNKEIFDQLLLQKEIVQTNACLDFARLLVCSS